MVNAHRTDDVCIIKFITNAEKLWVRLEKSIQLAMIAIRACLIIIGMIHSTVPLNSVELY
jgi:hypothetical protein